MSLSLRSCVRRDGLLELSLHEAPPPQPSSADAVVLRMEAAPLHPSDMALLVAGADMSRARVDGTAQRPVLTAPLPAAAFAAAAGRVDQSLPVGNEGAGTVVAAGSAPEAQALLGRRVAALGGGMYAQHRCLAAAQCLVLPEGMRAAQGAACFVNPLTALGMLETLRSDGQRALIHTVGASSLGQMLNRLCLEEAVALVSVVRRPEQAALLRGQGAQHVVDSSRPDFVEALTDAIAATGARTAFDATGGGPLAGQVIAAMEAALLRRPGQPYDRYGSQVHKQVYIYGYLERGPIVLPPGLGMAWGLRGWLLFPFLQQLAPGRRAELQRRVVDGLSTTFASHYARELSLAQLLDPQVLSACLRMGSGQKALLRVAAH